MQSGSVSRSIAVRLGWSGAQIAHALAVFTILAVGYLVVLLWADYISTIASAMILSQALIIPRKTIEQRLQQRLQHPELKSVADTVGYAKRAAIDTWEMPLIFLTALLLLELLRFIWKSALTYSVYTAVVWFVVMPLGRKIMLWTTAAMRWLASLARDIQDSALTRLQAVMPVAMATQPHGRLNRAKLVVQRSYEVLSTPPKPKPSEEADAAGLGTHGEPAENVEARMKREGALRAARLLLTSTVFLVVVDSALLGTYAARDVVDIARDSGGMARCALVSSGATNVTREAQRYYVTYVPEALKWVDDKLGEQWRERYCWPAIELVLTRSSEMPLVLVDATIEELRACYPSAETFLELVAPKKQQACSTWSSLILRWSGSAGCRVEDSEGSNGALRALLEYVITDNYDESTMDTGIWGLTQLLGAAVSDIWNTLGENAQEWVKDIASSDATMKAAEQMSARVGAFTTSSFWLFTEAIGIVARGINSALYVVVFFSFALSFLSMPDDLLESAHHLLLDSFLDSADRARVTLTERKLDAIRQTFWAASVLPVVAAARHAALAILVFTLFGLPYCFLAAAVMVGFALFPVTNGALVVSIVFGLSRLFNVVTCTGVTFVAVWQACGCLAFPMAVGSVRSEAERSLDRKIGVSNEVFSFAVFLGVTTFGWPGILFGPVLVCGSKTLFEVLSLPQNWFDHVSSEAKPGAATSARAAIYAMAAGDGPAGDGAPAGDHLDAHLDDDLDSNDPNGYYTAPLPTRCPTAVTPPSSVSRTQPGPLKHAHWVDAPTTAAHGDEFDSGMSTPAVSRQASMVDR